MLLEAFRPGVVDRLGVGYEQLRQLAPQLIYTSISTFGQEGPYRSRPAHDLATQALAGTLSINLGLVSFDIPGLGAHSEEILNKLDFAPNDCANGGYFDEPTPAYRFCRGCQCSSKVESMPWAVPFHRVEPSSS